LIKAVSLDANCSDAYLELGILAATEHDNEGAIRSYTKAIEADPQSADAHYRLAVAYDRIGETARAQQEFALHKQIEQQQAEATEKQRKAVKQFLFADPGAPAATSIK
jgi:Flp pilus assembly protein TadD